MEKKQYQIPQAEVATMEATGSVMVTSINTLLPGPSPVRKHGADIIE